MWANLFIIFYVLPFIIVPILLVFYYYQNITLINYLRIQNEYKLPLSLLHRIRSEFVSEMSIGLNENDNLLRNEKQSSLAMLSSYIKSLPNGNEKGVYYAIDWGGSNYRVSRIEFYGKNTIKPKIIEYKEKIQNKYKKCTDENVLFDYLSLILKKQLIRNGDYNNNNIKIGFTFSFPMNQLSLNVGILKEWRKGFQIPIVIGKNIVDLMHKSFKRNNIPGSIDAILNDGIGTLLSCAYNNINNNVRIGIIIGTGTNASYIEPYRNRPHNIINIEWGSFISKSMNKYLTSIDNDINNDLKHIPGMVKYSKNKFITKLISGNFLGELVRRLVVKIFKNTNKWSNNSLLNIAFKLQSEILTDALTCYYNRNINELLNILRLKFKLNKFDIYDAEIFAKICELICNRSADIAATMLLGILEKTGLYIYDNNTYKLGVKYNSNKYVSVGIDGSVYTCIPKYKQRMIQTMIRIVGTQIVKKIKIVNAKDGSGKGAAIVVAANKI